MQDTTIYVDTNNPEKVKEHYNNYIRAMNRKHNNVLPLDTLDFEGFVHVVGIATVYISGTGLKWKAKPIQDNLFK